MYGIEHREVSNSRGKRPGRDEEEDDEDGDNDMAAWERTYADERSWESLQEDESGLLQAIDNTSLYHAQYRRRLRSISSALTATRIQKGLIRYLYVVMDFSRVITLQNVHSSQYNCLKPFAISVLCFLLFKAVV